MKTTVVITRMSTGEEVEKNFITEMAAQTYYKAKCDERGYNSDTDTAGGVGCDYQIELI